MTKATRYLGAMQAGFCLPQLFECDDGKRYVVKVMSNPQGIRGLANELIACRLGTLLDLPVVPGCVVELPQALIDQTPELKQMRVQPGPHFGSLYLERVQGPSEQVVGKCANLGQVPAMIVFDLWVQNDDRDTGNVILTKEERPTFYMIDHESCFCGSGWYDEDLYKHRDHVEAYWSEVYTRFAPYIDRSSNPFAEALERLEALRSSSIREAMRGIPDEWGVEPEELDLLLDYLERRQKRVRDAVEKFKRRFPKWSGRGGNIGRHAK